MRKIKNVLYFLLLMFFIFSQASGKAEEVLRLEDGTIIYGKIIGKTKDSIIFKSAYGIFKIGRKHIIMHEDGTMKIKKKHLKTYKEKDKQKDKKKEKDKKKQIKKKIIKKKKIQKKKRVITKRKRNIVIGILTGVGLSAVATDVNEKTGYKSPKSWVDLAFQFGLNFELRLPWRLYIFDIAVNLQTVFERKNLKIIWDKDTANDDYFHRYRFDFLSFSLGVKGYFINLLYFGIGLTYGILLGDPKVETTSVSQRKVDDVFPGIRFKNNFGFYIEIGAEFRLNEMFSISASIKTEGSFVKIFVTSEDTADGVKRLSPRTYSLLAGFNMFL